MVKVAVAGGSGSIGRFIVDAIVASKKHDLIVLSRAPNLALEQLGVKVIPVSYDNPAELEAALQGVHTVISAIMDIDGAGWAAKQLALLAAAKKVGAKRFAPSEFSRRGVRDDALELYAYKVLVEEALKKSGLEYTLFECGVFMNYLANGTPGVGYLKPLKFVPDIENCSAYLAGDGSTEVVLTRAEDVGAFVAASLDLPKWPEESNMEGDRLSYKDVIAIAEKIRGKKFAVTYLSAADIQNQMDPHPSTLITNFYWQVMAELARGETHFGEPNLNALCPDVKPMGVEEYLRTWWGEKSQ